VGAGEAREGCRMASIHWEAGRACYEHIRMRVAVVRMSKVK
jgi:hypothetical protein